MGVVADNPGVLEAESSALPGSGEGEAGKAPVTRRDIRWLASCVGAATGGRKSLSRADRTRILSSLSRDHSLPGIRRAIAQLCQVLELRPAPWRAEASATDLPFIALLPDGGLKVVDQLGPAGSWRAHGPGSPEYVEAWPKGTTFLAVHAAPEGTRDDTAKGAFRAIFHADRTWIYQAGLASFLASILVLGTSLYSMQVYDRVLAHGGQSTLVVLTLGVLIAIGIELILKIARSRIIDRAVYEIDLEFAHEVFAKLMRIRLDQFPGGVGSLAAQVRGFEPVRQFIVSLTLFLVADAPFALFFLAMIYLLGGPIVAAGPALTLVVAVLGGLAFRRAVIRHSTLENLVGNRRQGVLVEAIQGLETLKSTGGVGRMMRRWNELSHQTAHETTELRHINELTTYFAGTMQQLSYVGLVASGAYLATTSNSMTSGSIVACSIISGRVLGAIASLPGLLVQWAQSRAALEGLEKLFALEEDNHRLDAPLAPAHLSGSYELREIEFSYPDQVSPLALHSLKIAAGEKVGILGAVGSGKSTLLKLLAGLAKPHRGIVLLDGLDLQHIAADRRSEGIGYLPQQTRLFSGTLRENLAIGLHDVGEQRLVEACRRTGLLDLISSRPSGLDTRISEGGEGLSGGQKRLVALTRTMLAQPDVWLLDEPTEGMDEGTELGCLKAIQAAVGPGQTLVLVTHNARVLALVDRLIILTPRGVAMDGPREAVIQAIRDAASATAAAAS